MAKVVVVTPKVGQTANDRRVLSGITSPSSAPSDQTSGYFLNRVEYVHLLFKLTNEDSANTCTFYIQLWWWSPISETWHIGERLKVNHNDVHTIEVQGLNRIYLQVDSVVYAGQGLPSLDAWLGMVVPT